MNAQSNFDDNTGLRAGIKRQKLYKMIKNTVYLEIFAIRNFREAPPELKFPEFNFREGVQGSLFILFI